MPAFAALDSRAITLFALASAFLARISASLARFRADTSALRAFLASLRFTFIGCGTEAKPRMPSSGRLDTLTSDPPSAKACEAVRRELRRKTDT